MLSNLTNQQKQAIQATIDRCNKIVEARQRLWGQIPLATPQWKDYKAYFS